MTDLVFAYTAPLTMDADGTIRIEGSRIPLDTIVSVFRQGATAEQIRDSFPSLPLSAIYGAIAWILENPEMVDSYLDRRRAESQDLREVVDGMPRQNVLRERLRARREQLTRS